MKICKKCGAINSDDRFFCLDCNEKLGDCISESEKKRIESTIDSKIENLYNDNDPLAVTLYDKIMGFISIVGILSGIILFLIGLFTNRDLGFLWISLLLLFLSALESFVPKLTWAIEKIRLSFYIGNSEDAQPSDFYKICRKTSIFIMTCIGIIILIFSFKVCITGDNKEENSNIISTQNGVFYTEEFFEN